MGSAADELGMQEKSDFQVEFKLSSSAAIFKINKASGVMLRRPRLPSKEKRYSKNAVGPGSAALERGVARIGSCRP